ncbi:MAG: ATP-binding protein [Butyricicoccus sp.]
MADENIKNNIGMKFAFRSTDIEIKKTLEFWSDSEDENNQAACNLKRSVSFPRPYGRVGVIKFHVMFDYLFHAFDARR